MKIDLLMHLYKLFCLMNVST